MANNANEDNKMANNDLLGAADDATVVSGRPVVLHVSGFKDHTQKEEG